MQTKREVLIQICETPGWQPPQPVPSSIDRFLRELQGDGWIRARLDGWEATPEALDEYPDFEGHESIADPELVQRTLTKIHDEVAERRNGQSEREVVSLDRVTVFIVHLMHDVPVAKLMGAALLGQQRSVLESAEEVTALARAIAERLR